MRRAAFSWPRQRSALLCSAARFCAPLPTRCCVTAGRCPAVQLSHAIDPPRCVDSARAVLGSLLSIVSAVSQSRVLGCWALSQSMPPRAVRTLAHAAHARLAAPLCLGCECTVGRGHARRSREEEGRFERRALRMLLFERTRRFEHESCSVTRVKCLRVRAPNQLRRAAAARPCRPAGLVAESSTAPTHMQRNSSCSDRLLVRASLTRDVTVESDLTPRLQHGRRCSCLRCFLLLSLSLCAAFSER